MTKKPMNKFLKFILWVAGGFIGLFLILLAAAAIIIPIKFPPEKLKAMATEKLSTTLKRQVSIGDVHFNVLSGFDIKNLKISNRPGWTDKPFVMAKDISISYHLLPLLWGQVSLGEIKLTQPQILVERRGLNDFNFSDMMGSSEVQAASAPTPASKAGLKTKSKAKKKTKAKKKHKKSAWIQTPTEEQAFSSFFADQAWADTKPADSKPSKTTLLLSVDSVNILHANLEYKDETVSPAQVSEAPDLNVKLKNISMVGGKSAFSIDSPFTFNKVNYQLDVAGSLRFFLQSISVKGLDMKGTVNGLEFALSGDALNITTDFAPTMDGETSLNMLQFSGLVPKSLSTMPEGLSLTGPAKVNFHLAGTVKKGLQLSGIADGSELAIQYKDLFVKTTKTPCKVDFKSVVAQDGSYDLPSYKVTYDQWEVSGAFHYPKGSPWSCEVRSKSLPLSGIPSMVPKLKKTTFEGGASMDLTISQASKSAIPYKINGQVTLKGVGITLPQEPYLKGMTGPMIFSGNLVRIPSIGFQFFDGTGVAGVTVNYGSPLLAYSYGLSLKNVNGQKAIDASMDAYVTKNPDDYKDKIFGNLNLAYSGSGRGTSGDSMIASQAGSGSYSIDHSKIKGFAVVKAINNYFKDKSDEITFDEIKGNLGMRNKVFSYTANTTGKVGAIREIGGINVADMVYSPDMKIQCDIKKEFLDSDAVQAGLPNEIKGLLKNPDWMADDNGNIPMDVKFTGPVKANNWSYDWDRLLTNVKNKVAKEAKKALDSAVQQGGKDLGDKLKGLFGQ